MKFRIIILIGLMTMLMLPGAALADDSKAYTDGEWGYTLEFASDLEVYNEGDGSVSFLDGNGVEIVRVDCYFEEATRSYDPLGGAVEGIYNILDTDYQRWELLSEEYEETWQGYQSGEIWYSSFDGNLQWEECDYIVFANDVVYLISMIWPEEDMNNYWEDFYQIVYSFSVL